MRAPRRGLPPPDDERRMLRVERWLLEGGAGSPSREELLEFVAYAEEKVEDLLRRGRPAARILELRNEARVLAAEPAEDAP